MGTEGKADPFDEIGGLARGGIRETWIACAVYAALCYDARWSRAFRYDERKRRKRDSYAGTLLGVDLHIDEHAASREHVVKSAVPEVSEDLRIGLASRRTPTRSFAAPAAIEYEVSPDRVWRGAEAGG